MKQKFYSRVYKTISLGPILILMDTVQVMQQYYIRFILISSHYLLLGIPSLQFFLPKFYMLFSSFSCVLHAPTYGEKNMMKETNSEGLHYSVHFIPFYFLFRRSKYSLQDRVLKHSQLLFFF